MTPYSHNIFNYLLSIFAFHIISSIIMIIKLLSIIYIKYTYIGFYWRMTEGVEEGQNVPF